ncbi:hypothetical protein ON010_g17613 [Phytophthora cinnamomi]|nr:hypothetical protein ON010_g17613 [Phytophthora cinnamomi]
MPRKCAETPPRENPKRDEPDAESSAKTDCNKPIPSAEDGRPPSEDIRTLGKQYDQARTNDLTTESTVPLGSACRNEGGPVEKRPNNEDDEVKKDEAVEGEGRPGRAQSVCRSRRKEEYEKELEEWLPPLDEVELRICMKKNAEQQRVLSLPELSDILEVPEETLSRTRASSPGELSSHGYWLNWYKETLVASEAAKRANLSRGDSDDCAVGGGEAPNDYPGSRLPNERLKPAVSIDETAVELDIKISVDPSDSLLGQGADALTGVEGRLPARWSVLARKTVYSLVKQEAPLDGTECAACSRQRPPSPTLSGDAGCGDRPLDLDLAERARTVAQADQEPRATQASVLFSVPSWPPPSDSDLSNDEQSKITCLTPVRRLGNLGGDRQ